MRDSGVVEQSFELDRRHGCERVGWTPVQLLWRTDFLAVLQMHECVAVAIIDL